MSIKQKLTGLINGFEDLIFKNHACLVCRREIPDGTSFSLCKNCLDSLCKIDGKLCSKCGDKIEDGEVCDICKVTEFSFDKNNSFCFYDDVSAKIVKRFKYGGRKYYGKHIAELMAQNDKYFQNVDYISFVPIGKKRKRERGFNQAEEIARELAEFKQIPILELLEKVGNEKHQAGLSAKARQQNLSGTIAAKKDMTQSLKGKTILIIDDVFTTGATLSECARVLKNNRGNKPKSVICYTFAKTVLNSTNNG